MNTGDLRLKIYDLRIGTGETDKVKSYKVEKVEGWRLLDVYLAV